MTRTKWYVIGEGRGLSELSNISLESESSISTEQEGAKVNEEGVESVVCNGY